MISVKCENYNKINKILSKYTNVFGRNRNVMGGKPMC